MALLLIFQRLDENSGQTSIDGSFDECDDERIHWLPGAETSGLWVVLFLHIVQLCLL